MAHDTSCCSSGFVHTGEPAGKDITLCGRPAYLAVPATPSKRAIIIATDIFGYKFVNNRLIADTIAAVGGILVVIPDLHDGESFTPEVMAGPTRPDLRPWFEKHNPEVVMPMLYETIDALRLEYGISHVGVSGYCWGGLFSIRLAATDKIAAFAVAHPSRVNVPDDIEGIKHPGLWLLAETDTAFPPESVAATEKILAAKPHLPQTFHTYPGTNHGFAVRGNPADPVVEKAKADALRALIDFFASTLPLE